MTPAARTEAAVEILDQVIAAASEGGAAADTLVSRYFGTRRYAGAKDRRAVRDLVYAAIRRAGERPTGGRAAMVALADDDPALAATFDGSVHGPAPIEADEPRAVAGSAPDWLVETLVASGVSSETMAALVGRAPLDLRVNRLKASREDVLAMLPEVEATPFAPDGLRLWRGGNVEAMPVYRDGLVEVQDEGSQIVGMALGAKPGDRIVDLCAGAGGKTLALAAAMANEGVLLAADVDRARLSRLKPRSVRAGVTIVETLLLDPNREAEALGDWVGTADGVLVDAPCSGTGTWRRNPEARWRLTPDRIDRLAMTQTRLLALAATLVRPGGTLAYIVCSLLDAEGAEQVDAFLAAHPRWIAEPPALPAGRSHGAGRRLDPARDGTDGFFVARLRAPC
ncbi:RsmB/NOP family class I SAM-dependent RNA methyltransferase [Sphingomonas bacterium]|uniref:RsmB/NOP family class I SAM-dependent RNA methyltransferase n=1 Tax=Sphingomonas bacterium TaxID=1895847 RepID=UPI001577035C|nr:RsmB/NOP family class I SAM-dependent RNA methyltransferase [Sphingomonas bacterium]